MSWINFKWKPKFEGPYLLKLQLPNPRKEGEFITRYFIKRYTVSLKPSRTYQREGYHLHGPYGYFSSGNLPEGSRSTMVPIAWMPIPGFDYMKLKKNQELEKRLYKYQKLK